LKVFSKFLTHCTRAVSFHYPIHTKLTFVIVLLFLRERDHWGDPDVDGRIILGGILRKWEGIVGTGWSGLRIVTGGGHL
jgi:hypothetical protein